MFVITCISSVAKKTELNLEVGHIRRFFVVAGTLGCTDRETARCHFAFGIIDQFFSKPNYYFFNSMSYRLGQNNCYIDRNECHCH